MVRQTVPQLHHDPIVSCTDKGFRNRASLGEERFLPKCPALSVTQELHPASLLYRPWAASGRTAIQTRVQEAPPRGRQPTSRLPAPLGGPGKPHLAQHLPGEQRQRQRTRLVAGVSLVAASDIESGLALRSLLPECARAYCIRGVAPPTMRLTHAGRRGWGWSVVRGRRHPCGARPRKSGFLFCKGLVVRVWKSEGHGSHGQCTALLAAATFAATCRRSGGCGRPAWSTRQAAVRCRS